MAGGQAITVGQGQIGPPRRGQLLVSTAGTVGLSLTVALFGQNIYAQSGTVTPNANGVVPLGGQVVTSAQQTIAPSWDQALTGSASTSERGTLSPVTNPTTSAGQVVTSASGTLVAAGPAGVTVNITGEEFTTSQGFVGSGSTLLSGIVATSGIGTVIPSTTFPIVGQFMTAALGVMSPNQDAVDSRIDSLQGSLTQSAAVPLVGSIATFSQGTLGITGDVTLVLTGSASTSASGTLIPTPLLSLSGQGLASAQSPFGAPGMGELTGTQIAVQTGTVFTTNDRVSVLTGQAATAAQGLSFPVPLVLASGQSLLVGQQVMGPKVVALTGALVQSTPGGVVAYNPQTLTTVGGWGFYKPKKKKVSTDVIRIPRQHERVDRGTVHSLWGFESEDWAEILPSVPQRVHEELALLARDVKGTADERQLQELCRRLSETGKITKTTLRELWGGELSDASSRLLAAIERAMAMQGMSYGASQSTQSVVDEPIFVETTSKGVPVTEKPRATTPAIDVESIVQIVEKRQAAREDRRSKAVDAQLKAYYAAEDHRKAMERQQAEAKALDVEQQRLASEKVTAARKAEEEALAEILLLAS